MYTEDFGKTIISMAKDSINLQMATITKDTFTRVQGRAKVDTYGKIKAVTKVTGKGIKCTDMEGIKHPKALKSKDGFKMINS